MNPPNSSRPRFHRLAPAAFALAVSLPCAAFAAADEAGFATTVRPFMQTYCYECHNAASKKGGVDLEMFSAAAVFEEHPTKLDHTIMVIEDGDMPPKRAKQPNPDEKKAVLSWLNGELARQQNVLPNDPGPVVMPRINSKEYDYVVREITGKPLEMGQFLTADTGGGEGFLNVGAALPMQVGNFESFLGAAKKLLGDHARITPNAGIVWFLAPQPPAEDTKALGSGLLTATTNWFEEVHSAAVQAQSEAAKREKMSVSARYLEAAWRYQHRAALGMPKATFAEIAAMYQPPLYAGSIEKTVALLSNDPATAKLFEKVRANPLMTKYLEGFRTLPAPKNPKDVNAARPALAAMDQQRREWINQDSDFGVKHSPFVIPPEKGPDSQAYRGEFHRGRQAYRMDLSKVKGGELYLLVTSTWDGKDGDFVAWKDGEFTLADGSKQKWSAAGLQFVDQSGRSLRLGQHAGGGTAGPEEVVVGSGTALKLKVPAGAKEMTVVAEFDPAMGKESTVQTQILDVPPTPAELMALSGRPILGQSLKSGKIQRAKSAIQNLAYWDEAPPPLRRIRNGVIFANAPATLRTSLDIKDQPARWSEWYLLSATRDDVVNAAKPAAREELASLEKLLADHAATSAQPASTFTAQARAALQQFAARAWRRPPTTEETERLVNLFNEQAQKGLTYDTALKVPLSAVLVSAPFLYRFSVAKGSDKPYPLQGTELATKLAFVLWASLPDEQLLQLGAQNRLHDPAVLNAQIKRMLADPRADAFIDHFLGMWLGFADFDKFAGPDAMKFEMFDDPLKRAMHDEARLFFLDLFRNDLPLTLALTADYTFANGRLAKHYGLPGVDGPEMRKVKVPADQRGGILGMGAFLTKFSAPLRTSPVHRGIWVYEYVLGQKLGEPPPNVPQLSDEEKSDKGLTIAQQLAEHRDNPACFSCHDKFDPLGVAMENFDPVGRWRTNIAGTPVDAVGKFGSGVTLNGFTDLRKYVLSRQDLFLETFVRKLTAYALGRSLLPTDKPLLDETVAALKAGGNKPSVALARIAESQQFRFRRDDLTESAPTASR